MNSNLKSRGFKALLITQFLGAFNDNAFKLIISFMAVARMAESGAGAQYLSAASALFILPFILFSSYAGYLADRFSKKTVMVYSKLAELIIMILGLIGFLSGNFVFIYIVLFLMGLQSTSFGPAKYGILPEILDEDEISEGNGLLGMWTFISIIMGIAFGGGLMTVVKGKVYLSSIAFIIFSLIGLAASFYIQKVSPSGSTREFKLNFLGDVWSTVKLVREKRAMFLSVTGINYFWFLGALFHLNILLYADKMMHLSQLSTGLLLTVLALGAGLGNFFAGRLSSGKIEFGLVPLGSIGLSVFSILLAFSYPSAAFTAACFFFLGVSSGFFVVPLNAYIQENSPKDSKGRFLAATNFLTNIGILAASGALWFILEGLKLSSAATFGLLGVLSIMGTIYIILLLPNALVRLLVWMLTNTIYKIKNVGTNNVPKEGGALLISNHVSFVDALLIGASLQRHVRFLMYRELYENPLLNWFFRLMKVIPISSKDGPKKIQASLQTAREAVASGELVCIFPEGQLTLTGHLRRFNRGLSEIVKGLEVPIIPIYLDRIWGSIFSFEDGKFFYKIPKIIPYPVTVMFGKALPSSANAFECRQAVRELGAEAFAYRIPARRPLHIAFWKEARRSFGRFCMADSTKKKLSYGKALLGAITLSQVIKSKCAVKGTDKEMTGVLLPPSCAGALANIALSMLGRTVVNLNYTCSDQILDSVITQCKIKHIITSIKIMEKLHLKSREEIIMIEDLIKEVNPGHKIKAFLFGFILPVKFSAKLLADSAVSITDLATVIFSSGSTGVPKGVMLSHANITSNIEGLYQVFKVDVPDRILGVLPFFHSFGYMATLWFPLIAGIGVVYHSNPIDAAQIGTLVHKNQVSILMSTPTFLRLYIKRCTPEQFKSLKIVIVGAEKLTEELSLAFEEKFSILPMEGYGATELSPIVSVNFPTREETKKQVTHKPGKIGLPLPGIAVKIVNPETMEELGVDQAGLLLVKGQNVMVGYLNSPEKTQEVIKDGWYITGDIAAIDSDGFLEITDRLSRFSKIGGEMAPHIKIEEEIQALLKTGERRCVVTGVKDEKKGEQLVVLYTGEMDIDAIWEALSKSSLPKLWIPKKDAFYKVDEMPILGTGKLDLMAIKKIAEDKHGQ